MTLDLRKAAWSCAMIAKAGCVMRRTSWMSATAGLAFLLGCTVPTEGILTSAPASPTAGIAVDGSVTLRLASVYDDGSDRLALFGTMKAYRSGVSSFTLSSPAGFTCSGRTDETWSGRQTCSDGSSFAFTIPPDQRGKLSGAYIVPMPGARVAIGWGRKADQVALGVLLNR